MSTKPFKLAGLDLSKIATSRSGNATRDIKFNKFGMISFSKTALEELKIKEETKFTFDHEEGNEKAWYLILGSGPLAVRKTSKDAFVGQSSPVCKMIMEKAGRHFLISKSPVNDEMPNVYFLIPKA